MKDPATGRAALNGEWVKMFPDETRARPAIHWRSAPTATPWSPAISSRFFS